MDHLSVSLAQSASIEDQEALCASLSQVVTGLLEDPETQAQAANRLASIIDRAQGATAEAVGRSIRDFGAVQPLIELLHRPATQQNALRVLGNLASNAVDVHADETKHLLHELGAFPSVVALIDSPSSATVVYALGAVQNMLTWPEYALHMRDVGADVRLHDLLATTRDETTRHFAQGCLQNMKAVLSPEYRGPPSAQQPTPSAGPPSRCMDGSAGQYHGAHALPGSSAAAFSYAPSKPADPNGALVRCSVPADNNCLFSTAAFLCGAPNASVLRGTAPGGGGGEPSLQLTSPELSVAARELRRECANMVKHSPDLGTSLALLGFEDADSYHDWITDETHWGGEPEVSMLSELYSVEVVVAVCDGTKLLHYGGGRRRKAIYILYTGQHYDPLVGPPPHHTRVFPPLSKEAKANAAREAAALSIAEEHNEYAAALAAERSLPAGSLPTSPNPVQRSMV